MDFGRREFKHFGKIGEELILGRKPNVLIQKVELGKARPSLRDLPSPDFVYGKPDLTPNRETVDQGKPPQVKHL